MILILETKRGIDKLKWTKNQNIVSRWTAWAYVANFNWVDYASLQLLPVDSQSEATWKRTHNTLRSPPEPSPPNLSLFFRALALARTTVLFYSSSKISHYFDYFIFLKHFFFLSPLALWDSNPNRSDWEDRLRVLMKVSQSHCKVPLLFSLSLSLSKP